MNTTTNAAADMPRCMHARCGELATVLLRPTYGVDWPACPTHVDAMHEALTIGMPGGVRRVPVDQPAQPGDDTSARAEASQRW